MIETEGKGPIIEAEPALPALMKANLGQSTSTRAGALNSRKTFTNIANSPSKLQQPKYTFNKSDQYKL